MKIEVPTRHLLAASVFAARQDIRYYLMGVLVEVTPDAIYCVGTDGCSLGATRHPSVSNYSLPFIVPVSAIKTLNKPKSAGELTAIYFQPGGAFSFGETGGHLTHKFMDAHYPAWRDVIPTSAPSGEAAQFSIELLSKYVTASQILSMRKSRHPVITIGHNGKDGSRVSIAGHDSEFLGFAMPLRNDYVANDDFIL